jgi:hypothetical protein
MLDANAPIPVRMASRDFGGWNRNLFGDIHAYGEQGVRFCSRYKAAVQHFPTWPLAGSRRNRNGPWPHSFYFHAALKKGDYQVN